MLVSVERNITCDLRAVDFDGDGDVDLFLGQEKYFERLTPTTLVERNENPLAMFNGNVMQLADVDGDGHLDVIVNSYRNLRFFRRSADGQFIESLTNPLSFMDSTFFSKVSETAIADNIGYRESILVADWNSDGLPDLLEVRFRTQYPDAWEIYAFYEHSVNWELKYNSHFTSYEDIKISGRNALGHLLDWDKNEWDDVILLTSYNQESGMELYEVNERNVKQVTGVFEKVRYPGIFGRNKSVRLVDLDRDGKMDFIMTWNDRLIFHELVSGQFQANPHHPLSQLRLNAPNTYEQIVPVDWDQDGDLDLLVLAFGHQDGHYFEQQGDGSFREKPLDETPFRSALDLHPYIDSWHFLDCDGDGDLDLVLVMRSTLPKIFVSKNENGTFQKIDFASYPYPSAYFVCLGTDLHYWRDEFQGFGTVDSVSVGSADGRLRIVASHVGWPTAVLWTAGFCKPRDPCNQKGSCPARQARCECVRGYELQDCSRCEPQYYTASLDGRHVRSCQPCPGEPNVCHGRGRCLDDVAARNLSDHAAALMATGNGSCLCYEAGC